MQKLTQWRLNTRIMWVDAVYQLEIIRWGKVSFATKYLRHYYLKRLLKLQLEEFKRD